jgi:histidyl-tRNA synthetase
MALSTQPYKGTRDFFPEDKRLQKYIFSVMRSIAEKFGYEEYDAPLIEPIELYAAKSGQEIVNEQTYRFTDRGGREVAIRPEMTPTVSRMVAAKRQELGYPLRWYSIPNLWRYERPQRGRLREHWQLNVDIFGVKGLEAEHEIISVADGIMRAYGAKRTMYQIKINSRKLMNAIFGQYLNVSEIQAQTLAKLIDRMNKMEHAAFVADVDALFTPTQRETGASDKLIRLLQVKTVDELPPELYDHECVKQMKDLMLMLENSGITNAVFDITIMRGFDYYTDVVFEVFDTHPDNNRSMFGGGRYDGLVALFGVEPVPTVGFGMGDVTISNFIETHELMPPARTETDLYVILVGDVYVKAQKTIDLLREMGLNVAVDASGRKPGDQIKNAVKKDIHYVLFIGDKELEEGRFTLKNLTTGVEEQHSPERAVSIVKDYRKPHKDEI